MLIDHIDVYGKDRIEIHFRFEDEIRQMIQNLEYYEAHKFQDGPGRVLRKYHDLEVPKGCIFTFQGSESLIQVYQGICLDGSVS